MSDSVTTSSTHWRQQGNSLYTSVKEGLSPVIKKERFKKAIQCYQKAFDVAGNDDEQASAAKNLGMSCWRLLNVFCEREISSLEMVLYYWKEAFKYFSFAYQHGKSAKCENWLEGILSNMAACFEEVSTSLLEKLDYDPRCQALYDISQIIQVDIIKAQAYSKLAECEFHRGINALQKNDYKKCLSAMRECYMPLNEALMLTKEDKLLNEMRVLEQDVFMHQCMAESIQARAIGDSLFEQVLMDQEVLNMDMVWEVIDWYKQATIRTREITEVELEAIAASRIGRVYDRVLKMTYRAKEYYKHAVQLALSMTPRSFASEEWYREATQTLEKYQQNTVSAEDEKAKKEKAEILKALETEIKQLAEKVTSTDEHFLKFVYTTFPPKDERKKLDMPEKNKDDDDSAWQQKMKKLLQKAVIHYHPDSVDEKLHGKKWKVLSEEITKCLTRRYEVHKRL